MDEKASEVTTGASLGALLLNASTKTCRFLGFRKYSFSPITCHKRDPFSHRGLLFISNGDFVKFHLRELLSNGWNYKNHRRSTENICLPKGQ